MPSGKPRSHRRNPGGRPTNKERLDELQAEIGILRQLLYHRRLRDDIAQVFYRIAEVVDEMEDRELHERLTGIRQLVDRKKKGELSAETWLLINRFTVLVNELDDLATPQRAATWEGPGHGVDPPIFPGVAVTERGIVHAGTYAADLNRWFHRQVRWTIATTENRLKGKEADPKPRPPRRETSYQENPITNNANG